MATNEELAELIKQGHTELYNDLWEQMKKLLIFYIELLICLTQ